MTETVLLWNARLIDGRGGPPVEAASVSVTMTAGRIAAGASAGELVRMAEAGLGAAAAIRAATQGSACALGLTEVGTVEPGRIADLLVVDGDPLEDPGILLEPERIRLVIQAGRVVGGTRSAPTDIRP